jgi:hypothetical protein
MARILTCGFEAGSITQETTELGGLAFQFNGVNQPTPTAGFAYATATKRSGAMSLQIIGSSTTGEDSDNVNSVTAIPVVANLTHYLRVAVYPVTLPTTDDLILMTWYGSNGAGLQLVLSATGVLEAQTWSGNTTQFTGGSLPLNQWSVVEVAYTASTGATAIRVNGLPTASGTTEIATGSLFFQIGAPTTACNVFVDDVAVNDSTGAAANSWCGLGGVFFLKGTSDASRVGFTTGAGGTTSLFAATNQTPSNAVAQASATATSQVEDATSNTTDYYSANIESANTYGAAIAKGSIPILAQGWCSHGNSSATQRTNGLSVTTGAPVIGETTGSTPAVAAGAWPTGWAPLQTAYSYWPAINSNSGCYLKFRKGTASTDYAMCASMALMVEYAAPTPQTPGRSNQAMIRAMSR